jgi:hypothetical protein
MLHNFSSERDRQKLSIDHWYKNGIKESNGDVTFGLLRPLVPDTTSGRNLENHKTLKNSQTAANRQVKHEDTNKPSSVGLSNSDTISDEWRRLQPISASGPFCQKEKAQINRERREFDAKFL